MRHHHALRLCSISLLVCGWALALAACAPPQPPQPPYFSATDVSLDSPTDGWAVGNWITRHTPPAGVTPDASLTSPQFSTIISAMAHLQHGQWRLAPMSVTGNLDPDQSYNLVRMHSPSDGWATTRGSVVHYGDDIYHYDGARWHLVYPPAGTALRSITIADLEMFSPDIGWAVGEDGILQYTHGSWMNVTDALPPPPVDWLASWEYPGLRTVTIVSPTDVWAMGDGGMIWRYDGVRWRIVANPYFPNEYYTSVSVNGFAASDAELAHFALLGHSREALYATQMLSPTQGWSVGGANPLNALNSWGPAVVEQYQADTWQVIHIVNSSPNGQTMWPEFSTLAMTSAQDVWIGGAWGHAGPRGSGDANPGLDTGRPLYAPLLLHYHARAWTFVQAPAVGAIHRLVMVSPDEGWAASDGGLLHYIGGQWRLASVTSSS